MLLFKRPRHGGKTTALIHTSAVTGYPIICHCYNEVDLIKKQAEQMQVRIPEPISVYGYDEKCRGKKFRGLLIDNLDIMLPKILEEYFGAPIVSATMTEKE